MKGRISQKLRIVFQADPFNLPWQDRLETHFHRTEQRVDPKNAEAEYKREYEHLRGRFLRE